MTLTGVLALRSVVVIYGFKVSTSCGGEPINLILGLGGLFGMICLADLAAFDLVNFSSTTGSCDSCTLAR